MWRGLHFKLAMIVTVGALLLASVSSIWLYQRSYDASLADSKRSLTQLLATVQVTAGIAAYVGNAELATQVLEGLLLNDVVLGAELADDDLLQVRLGQFDDAARTRAVVQALPHPLDPAETVGALRVLPNQALIEHRAGAVARTATIGLATHTFTVAFLVLVAVYLMLTKPLVRLSDGLHRIIPGQKQRLIAPTRRRRDELGNLVGDINRLLDTVEKMLTEERHLRERVELLEQRFRGIFEGSSAGIFLMRDNGALVTANPAFHRTVGLTADALEASGADVVELVFANPEAVRTLVATAIEAKRPISADLQLRGQETDGSAWVHALFSSTPHPGGGRMVEGVLYDITERKHAEESARRQAELDPLTGLPNRHSAEIRLREQIAAALDGGESVTLMLMDLDHFKPVNDRHGHDAGDLVLVTIAQRLQRVVRASDTVARLGGDEFLVILGGSADAPVTRRIARGMIDIAQHAIQLPSGASVIVRASVGVARCPADAADAEALRTAADAAMYAVKRAGRDGYALYGKDGRHRVYRGRRTGNVDSDGENSAVEG